MHFIDYLLHLLCFFCWAMKNLYIISFEYVIPIIGYVLPILIKHLSQLFTLILRGFLTYIAPCIIQIINGTTYCLTHILNGFNVIFTSIVESDLNLEYAHAIAMTAILVAIIYFHITQRLISFGRGILLYARFIIYIWKVLMAIVKYIYSMIAVMIVGRQNENESNIAQIKNHRKQSNSNSNGNSNGSIHRIQNNNNNNKIDWTNRNEKY